MRLSGGGSSKRGHKKASDPGGVWSPAKPNPTSPSGAEPTVVLGPHGYPQRGAVQGRLVQTGPAYNSPAAPSVGSVITAPSGEAERRSEDRGDRVDPARFNPSLRSRRLRSVRYLTEAEYEALTPEQQQAVQFNTGLLDAAQADEDAGSGTTNTQAFMDRLGIKPRSDEEMSGMLRLDRLVGSEMLDKLAEPAPVGPVVDMGPQPDQGPILNLFRPKSGENIKVTRARSDASKVASALADQLRTTGFGFGEQPTEGRIGMGTSVSDDIVRKVYNAMATKKEFGPEDILDGIAQLNAASGANVTPQQVWDFMNSQLMAAEADGSDLLLPWNTDPVSGEKLQPLKPAEIRKRYGL